MSCGTTSARGLVGFLLACTIAACQADPADDGSAGHTTVLLVRHAEKEITGDDPGLTALGGERAAALAHVLGEVEISAVYATQFARTRATASPVADMLGLEVSVVAAGSTYAAEMADIVRSRHQGETIVIVSHSNTVPAVMGALGVSRLPVIDDDEYDDLYVVTISPSGYVNLLPLRYGRETL